MARASVAQAMQQLNDLHTDIRLIIAHPNEIAQHTLFSLFADGVYVRFDGVELTTADLYTQLNAAVAEQTDGEKNIQIAHLLLDECDRVNDPELITFLIQVMKQYSRARVVVFSRSSPFRLLKDATLRAAACCLPTGEMMMLWNYAEPRPESSTLLEVRSLGTGRAQLNGQPVEAWDGVLPRALFFYLVDRGMVTRTEIFETFWPNLTVREATNVFHVTKRKINEVLGVDLTKYGSGYYHIAPNIQLSYDVALFTQILQDSEISEDEQAVSLLESALALYRGRFLTSLNAEWTQRRRQNLRSSYGEALEALAAATERLGDERRALGYYRRAAASLPATPNNPIYAKIAMLENTLQV